MGRPEFFLLAFNVLFALCGAEYSVAVQSVRMEQVDETRSSRYSPTGCKIWSTDVDYRCARSPANGSAVAQLLTMRVDCRGTRGDFQNLTIYEERRCVRLTYRKYGNSSMDPTKPWLPLIYDHIMTMEKDDVVDIQCVLGPIALVLSEHRKTPQKDGSVLEGIVFPMYLLLDGVYAFQRPVNAYTFQLYYPPTTLESCQSAVVNSYKWNMSLKESMNNSHLIRFAGPKLNIPANFPPLDLVFETGEIFRADKDWLHIRVLDVLVYTSGDEQHNKKLVTLDETFYDTNVTEGFAVEVKLDVNVAALPRGHILPLKVLMGFDLENGYDKGDFWISLPLEPDRNVQENAPLVWLMILFIFLILGASLCYVHRPDLSSWTQSFHVPGANGRSIEMQRPVRPP